MKLLFRILMLLFLFPFYEEGRANDSSFISKVPMSGNRLKVGLVLGGGGAKGAAEVGVLKVLEETGIPVDYIAGTSIGSIVGGLYAIGYSPAELDSLFRYQDWLYLLSDKIKRESKSFSYKRDEEVYILHIPFSSKKKRGLLPRGYVAGQNITNLFSRLTVGYHQMASFSDLPIPFTCVATDLVSGKEVDISSGSLPLAMRASMSIPGVFSPVDKDGMLLVDGGTLNNFPVDVVRKMGADVVIGVDLSTGWKNKNEFRSFRDMFNQLINIMGQVKYKQNSLAADVYINPYLRGFTPANFQRTAIDSMLLIGEKAARLKIPELIALKKKIFGNDTAMMVQPVHRMTRVDSFDVDTVIFQGVQKSDIAWLKDKIKLPEKGRMKLDEIDRAVSVLQGLNLFAKVEYQLQGTSPYQLVIQLTERAYQQLNVGLYLDTEEIGALLLNISNNQKLSSLHHYGVTGRVSRNPYLKLDYSYGSFFKNFMGLSYRLQYNNFRLYKDGGQLNTQRFLSQSANLYFQRTLSNFGLQVGIEGDYYKYDSQAYYSDGRTERKNNDLFLNYYVDLVMDNYDRTYFPTRGAQVEARGTMYTDNGWTIGGYRPCAEASFHAETVVRMSDRWYFLPALKARFLFGKNVPWVYQNFIGGQFNGNYLQQQMAWESALYAHLIHDSFLAARMALRYRIKNNFYLTMLGEYGRDANRFRDAFQGKPLWGCALRASYDFLFGPVGAQVNFSNFRNSAGLYLYAGFKF